MSHLKARDEKFHRESIRPLAEKLAEKTLTVIKPQLYHMGVKDTNCCSGNWGDGSWTEYEPQQWWRIMQSHLEEVFFQALFIKGILDAGFEHFIVEWPEIGADFDRKTMTQPKAPITIASPPHEVAYCIMPRIMVRHVKESQEGLVHRAHVVAKRKLDPIRWRGPREGPDPRLPQALRA